MDKNAFQLSRLFRRSLGLAIRPRLEIASDAYLSAPWLLSVAALRTRPGALAVRGLLRELAVAIAALWRPAGLHPGTRLSSIRSKTIASCQDGFAGRG